MPASISAVHDQIDEECVDALRIELGSLFDSHPGSGAFQTRSVSGFSRSGATRDSSRDSRTSGTPRPRRRIAPVCAASTRSALPADTAVGRGFRFSRDAEALAPMPVVSRFRPVAPAPWGEAAAQAQVPAPAEVLAVAPAGLPRSSPARAPASVVVAFRCTRP